MTTNNLPGDEHLRFMEWALSEGIEINGVAPAKFPGEGLGMVASRVIEEDEIIINVPSSLMLTIDCIPSSFINLFRDGAAIQAILAAYLTRGDKKGLQKWDAWRKIWPSRQSFEDSMPILWPEPLQTSSFTSQGSPPANHAILPPSASGIWPSISKTPLSVEYEAIYQNILAQEQKRLHDAWEDATHAFPDMDWVIFSYHWLIVNSRSFYYVSPGAEAPKDWNDALGLVPFADYFNHLDDPACDVSFNDEFYTFKANKRIEKGEQVHISYGSHSNDFLFVEYGFFLDDNPSDAIYLDDIIFRDITTADRDNLELRQCYGNYQIESTGADSRVEAVACMKYMDGKNWQNYMLGESTEGVDPQKTAEIICGWIETYLKECKMAIENIEKILTIEQAEGQRAKISAMMSRWIQIKCLCEDAMDAIHAVDNSE